MFVKSQSLCIFLIFTTYSRKCHLEKNLSILIKLKLFCINVVCRIFKSLLIAVKQLHNKLGYHGDITPQFIYVD
jgi:hypothetical protein